MTDMHPGADEMYGLVRMTDEMVHEQVADLSHAQQTSWAKLVGFGFDKVQALRLARAGAPWARIERALLAGCTLDQALEIWT